MISIDNPSTLPNKVLASTFFGQFDALQMATLLPSLN